MSPEVNALSIQLIWEDPSTGDRYERLASLPLSLGRGRSNTIILNSQQVSEEHARLENVNSEVVLSDQHSKNGVFVNGQPLTRAVLQRGDSFQIGPFVFTVNSKSAAPLSTSLRPLVIRWTEPDTSERHEEVTSHAPISFGRAPGNTIILTGPKASRHHAVIEARQNDWVLVDQGSRNGTWLNGQPCHQAQLQAGDTIRIAGYTFNIASPGQVSAKDTSLAEAEYKPLQVNHRAEATLTFSEQTGHLLPRAQPIQAQPDFPPPLFAQTYVPIRELQATALPLSQTTYLTIGGGLGSFAWVDHLLIYGAKPSQVVAIGFEPKPYSRYQRLCRHSQIPNHERLRSNSDSCPDNIWGWPGYAVREAWQSLWQGDLKNAAYVIWQVFGEPTLAETYTPRAGDVFVALDREAKRIGWKHIWRYGSVRAIRKTDDGRYVIAYSQTNQREGRQHKLLVANYVHVAVGYPAIKLLPDLRTYREQNSDFKRVVNAYEAHEHIYEHLEQHGGTVLVRGRGIVASRLLQRLYEIRSQNKRKNLGILHLVRSRLHEGQKYKLARRVVQHHWEFQPFNWPKACWGGDLRALLEQQADSDREQLFNDWGGTTTANRHDWRHIVESGLREGWYQLYFGEVEGVECNQQTGKLVTSIRGNPIQTQTQLLADFIIDATGLVSNPTSNSLLKDMIEHYRLEQNTKGGLTVTQEFEVAGMRNGRGRLYACGIMTLGGPYAPVDSFLGLQFAAQRAVDALTALSGPGLHYLNGFRSIAQWLRWLRGVHP